MNADLCSSWQLCRSSLSPSESYENVTLLAEWMLLFVFRGLGFKFRPTYRLFSLSIFVLSLRPSRKMPQWTPQTRPLPLPIRYSLLILWLLATQPAERRSSAAYPDKRLQFSRPQCRRIGPTTLWHAVQHIVTCQPIVGLRNRALLGSRPVNKISAQTRWRHATRFLRNRPRWRHTAARSLSRQHRCKHRDLTQQSWLAPFFVSPVLAIKAKRLAVLEAVCKEQSYESVVK
jgi:hypothetical protein